jgi:hypothetical protein
MHYSVTVSIRLTTEILYHNISAPQNMNYSVSTNTQPTKGTAYRQFFLNNILYQLSTINFFTFYAQCMIMLLIDTTPGSVRTGRGAHLRAKESGGRAPRARRRMKRIPPLPLAIHLSSDRRRRCNTVTVSATASVRNGACTRGLQVQVHRDRPRRAVEGRQRRWAQSCRRQAAASARGGHGWTEGTVGCRLAGMASVVVCETERERARLRPALTLESEIDS